MSGDKDRRKPLILHVLKSSVYSGAENVILTIMRNLSDRFDFIYVAGEGPIRQVLEKEGIPFRLLPRFSVSQVRKAVRTYDPDVVHAHDFSASVLCAAVKGRFRLLSHLHNDPPWTRSWNLRSLAYAACRARIDLLLAVSGRMFQGMVFAGLYRDCLLTIGNPLDGARIRRMAADTTNAGTADGRQAASCDLIFAGRLEEPKDPLRFIRLVSRLKAEGHSRIKAVMLGDGRMRADCEGLIADLDLEDTIRMEGFQMNPYPRIAAARILCVTSRREGYGLAAAEAGILGVPVVTTATAGSLEIFGENAPELCHGDEEFLEKIKRLLEDGEEYEKWRRRAEMRAETLDNLRDYMLILSEIYQGEGSI